MKRITKEMAIEIANKDAAKSNCTAAFLEETEKGYLFEFCYNSPPSDVPFAWGLPWNKLVDGETGEVKLQNDSLEAKSE